MLIAAATRCSLRSHRRYAFQNLNELKTFGTSRNCDLSLPMNNKTVSPRKSRLHGIQNWVELADQANWNVSSLAKLCGVSVRTLQRHFPKEIGMSPKSWISQQRQKRAINLLAEHRSIKETADLLAYKHATHFSRGFKKHWGHPPACPAIPAEAVNLQCRNSVQNVV